MTTAQWAISGLRTRRLSNVVLPAPRKPVITDTGMGASAMAAILNENRAEIQGQPLFSFLA
jgi:hypothetical protein